MWACGQQSGKGFWYNRPVPPATARSRVATRTYGLILMARSHQLLRTISLLLTLLSGTSLPLSPQAEAAPPAQYSVRFANGERFAGDDLTDWYRPEGSPKLQGRALFDAGNPIRWMINQRLPAPQSVPQFVETFAGDRIPGRTVRYEPAKPSFHEQWPAHFQIEPSRDGVSSAAEDDRPYRVAARWVRRIVWQRRSASDYRPRTVFLRNGGQLSYRVARFSTDYVTLLLAEGTRKVAYVEIAELHFPPSDPWQLYLDELALLAATDPVNPPATPTAPRLIQLETVGGLVATASLARLVPRTTSDPKLVDRWLHGIQPAWSLDVIWVPHGEIRTRRFFAVHEVPLSRLFPLAATQVSAFGTSTWPARQNANARGGPLRGREGDFGWGYGVHAISELRFPLDPLVNALRTEIGLASLAGSGGCIRARILQSPGEKVLHETGFLTGASPTTETGWLPIRNLAAGQQHELVLQVDLAHEGRPPGADPLDIRDITNWADPLLQLEPARLATALESRRIAGIAAWSGWQPLGITPAHLRCGPRFQEWDDTAGRFATTLVAVEQPIVLSQRRTLTPRDRWLVVNATRSQNGDDVPRLQIRIGGEIVAEEEFPLWDRSHLMMQPIVVPLVDFQSPDQPVEIQVCQLPGSEKIPIQWHAIRISHQHPALYELFEDEGEFLAGQGEAATPVEAMVRTAMQPNDVPPHSGTRLLRVPADGAATLRLPHAVSIRERPQPGEFRFLRFAFRKAGGRLAIDLQAADSADVRRYRGGPEVAPEQTPLPGTRVWTKELPDQWIPITRDLFGDFRDFELQGLTLENPDGTPLAIDHVYLARSQNDFQLAAPATPPDESLRQARRALAEPVRERGLPAVVFLEFADGRRASGTIISADGEIVTAGHHVWRPQQEVQVRLADGRQVKAKTLGVDRDHDLGLLKISDKPPFPFVDVHATDQFPSEPIYLGVAHQRSAQAGAPPAAHLVGIRRVLGGEVWTDFSIDGATTGGPLLGADGRLMGVHSRYSPFGGVQYAHFQDWPSVLNRLKKAEVWGSWRHGTGPMLGVEIINQPAGCAVSKVFADQPAAQAGLQPNDLILQVDGQPVSRLAQIYARLATRDPGQAVTIDYRRGTSTAQATIPLAPRLP